MVTDLVWQTVFELGCYLAVLVCFYHVVSEYWLRPSKIEYRDLVADFAILGLFLVVFHALESWAFWRAPLFYYANPALIGFAPIDLRPLIELIGVTPDPHACIDAVHALHAEGMGQQIPFSISCMETALAFCALRTARYLGISAWLRPFLAGVITLNVDLILDPALTTSSTCDMINVYPGLGLWNWVEDEIGWFGVPTWNFAVWFAAPIVAGALSYWVIRVVHWTAGLISPSDLPVMDERKSAGWGTITGIIFFGVLYIALSAHDFPLAHALKRTLVLGAAAVVVAITVLFSGKLQQSHKVRWGIVLPQLFFLIFPLAYLIWSGDFLFSPSVEFDTQTDFAREYPPMAFALGAGVLLFLVGTFYAFSPYLLAMTEFERKVTQANRLLRIHYFAFTSMHVLLGAGVTYVVLDGEMIGWLLLSAVLFHVFMVLLNDWADFEIDRHQPRRRNDPLVLGSIQRTTVLVLALTPVPLAFLVIWAADGDLLTYGLLAVAYASMALYNLFGKKFFFPPLMDFVQGIGWGALALFGAHLVVGELPVLAWLVAASSLMFIMLVNGVHGSLRDLENDAKQGAMTTAIWAGKSHGMEEGGVSARLRRMAYAYFVLHILIITGLYAVVSENLFDLLRTGWVFILVALLIWSSALIKVVVREGEFDRDPYISRHALALMLSPIVVLVPTFRPEVQVVTMLAFILPFLALDPRSFNLVRLMSSGVRNLPATSKDP